jgi:hypothetical protein
MSDLESTKKGNIIDGIPSVALKNLQPPMFTGKRHDDVDVWLLAVERYFRFFNLDHEHSIMLALALMEDNARVWANNYKNYEAIHWDEFKKDLRERFGSPNSIFFARDQLYNIKQKGSVTSYIQHFNNITAKIEDLGDSEAIQCFIRGLDHRIQAHFAGNPDQRSNLNNVMKIAESFDHALSNNHRPRHLQQFKPHHNNNFNNRTSTYQPRINNNQQQSTRPFPYQAQNYRNDGPQPMELDAMQSYNRQYQPFNKKQEDMKKNACFYCHQLGHQAKNCPNKTKTQSYYPKARSQ